jgi:carboxylate-amine ligase
MAVPRPAFTVGIEEEYLLVDPVTRDLVHDAGVEVVEECRAVLGERVAPEFLQAQIEVATGVCEDVPAAREELKELRRTVLDVAAAHGMAVIAASTHPFADWGVQRVTDEDRYIGLARDMQAVVRRLVICGMHVHVGIDDPDLRIDLMNQASYFLPHILALSTSSPFWRGMETGLKSYRMSVFYSMPRTGLPEEFSSWGEYERHVGVLVGAGLIEDASKLWWDLRPSARFPTLEMRIADICTRVDDGIAIASLFQALLGTLFHRRLGNQKWRTYADMLVSENVWRAQRYGVSDSLVDFGKGELIPMPELVDELIDLLLPAAHELRCVHEIEHLRHIAANGTSADRQLDAYRDAVASGAEPPEALRAVVDVLIADTKAGL